MARLSYVSRVNRAFADVAQLEEQLICNQQVKGSSPFVSSSKMAGGMRPLLQGVHPASATRGGLLAGPTRPGGVPEWPKGADCKSAGDSLRRFESYPHHSVVGPGLRHRTRIRVGAAGVAQLVEHQPSKLRVAGSSPVARSR